MESFIPPPDVQSQFEPIDLSLFKDHVKESLLNILDNLQPKEKTLIIEKTCIPTIDFFTELDALVKRGVKRELLSLRPSPYLIESDILLYIIPPKKEFIKIIESQIKNDEINATHDSFSNTPNKQNVDGPKGTNKDYHIIFIPKINGECQTAISESDYRASFNCHHLNIDVYPLYSDVLSLEDPNAARDIYINENFNCLSVLSRVMGKFETVFGKINKKYVLGENAKRLNDLLIKEEENSMFENDTTILGCIMMDRSVDFITPICSQYTYEGMLDDYCDIFHTSCKINSSIIENEKQGKIKIDLSEKDKFYTMIKAYNFNKIRQFLPDRLKLHSLVIQESKNSRELKEVSETLEKVKMVKNERQSLSNHISIADFISQKLNFPAAKLYIQFEQILLAGGDVPSVLYSFYDKELGNKSDMFILLKLICIENMTQKKIKESIFDKLKKDFLLTYGFQEIFLWNNLEKLGILSKKESRIPYDYIIRKLHLIEENVDLKNPNDPAYSYGGYCPITIRLIEKAIKEGWNRLKTELNIIERINLFPSEKDENEILNPKDHQNFILLVFIGGITYGEIDAIRYLNESCPKHKFIILTTGIINSKRFLDSMRNKISFDSLTFQEASKQFKNLS